MTFGCWLLTQDHRNDAIGDLARDLAAGCHCCPDRDPTSWSAIDVRQDLDDHDASPGAFAALDRAQLMFVEPGGIIELPTTLDDVEFEQLRSRWNEQHRGVSNAHRVAILDDAASALSAPKGKIMIGRVLCALGFHAVRCGCPREGRWCGRLAEAVFGADWRRLSR